jgi:hypothetical protein
MPLDWSIATISGACLARETAALKSARVRRCEHEEIP